MSTLCSDPTLLSVQRAWNHAGVMAGAGEPTGTFLFAALRAAEQLDHLFLNPFFGVWINHSTVAQ